MRGSIRRSRHFRLQKLRSFWSAPRIETSGSTRNEMSARLLVLANFCNRSHALILVKILCHAEEANSPCLYIGLKFDSQSHYSRPCSLLHKLDGLFTALCRPANDPRTANNPQIVPEMIPGPELIPPQKVWNGEDTMKSLWMNTYFLNCPWSRKHNYLRHKSSNKNV